ncbi:MAG TPA: heat-inducible transcriptional repressor HrcA [Acidimicrobiia bacterium]
MLEERRSDVLRALVEAHIKTGEPVSSRAILAETAIAVSAATIRHDLAALEKDGFVVQPHTSAGRIPTPRAYRYYVDHIGRGRLASSDQARIAGFFSSVQLELSNLFKATSQLLAEVTHYPAVVVSPGPSSEVVRGLHLVTLTSQSLMAVIVTDRGRVIQHQIRLDQPIGVEDVGNVEQIAARNLIGCELGRGPDPAEIFSDQPDPVKAIGQALMQLLRQSAASPGEIYVGGTRQMAEAWPSLGAVHRVLEVLEREAELLSLLVNASGVSIRIGGELPVAEGMDLAVVSTTYEAGGAEGSVGVIGPMRMDYRTAISAVEKVGQGLEDRIGT